ncbi:MAG TPA: MFS transporter [Candidatus Saccharimonadia bacterium]|nr:MFS transporter [Candidatus Saccharimonadia bacterium]
MRTYSDLTKVKTALVTGSAVFWIAIMVIYLQRRGFSLPQIYSLIAVYYGSVVVLELPTGAIGDHFSHRLATTCGYLLAAVMFFALGFAGNYWYYAVVLLVGSLGMTLVSGNDTASLFAASKDFKRDQSQVKFWVAVMQVTTTALGSVLLRFSLGLPFWINGVFLLVASASMLSVRPLPQERSSGHPVAVMVRALRYAAGHRVVRNLLILAGTTGAFFLSVKWFFNPMLQGLGIPLGWWGSLIGLTLIAPLAGIWLYRQERFTIALWVPVLLFAGLVAFFGVTRIGLVSLVALYSAMAVYGYLDTTLSVRLNSAIAVAERASILSLASLFQRLGTSIYTPIAGIVLARTSLATVMVGTSGLLIILMVPVVISLRRERFDRMVT